MSKPLAILGSRFARTPTGFNCGDIAMPFILAFVYYFTFIAIVNVISLVVY
jgi:hypothetical protein